MKYFTILILVISSLTMTGCDTLNHRQFLVVPTMTKEEVIILKKDLQLALQPLIDKHSLLPRQINNDSVNILFFYETQHAFPIQLGSKKTNKGIVVDIIHFHPGSGEVEQYSEIIKEIEGVIANMKGVSFLELDYSSQIK